MITRIHGAGSTLAANPPRKLRRIKRKRRNPETAKPKKARAKVGRTLAERLSAYQKKVEALTERAAKAAERAARKGKGRRGPGPKAAARKVRRMQKASLGYSVRALPEGAENLGYAYPMHGRKDKKGRMRYTQFGFSPTLTKKAKPKFTLYRQGNKTFLQKNPAVGKLVIAGVPVINMAIGSAAAIAIGVVAEKLVARWAPSVASSPIGDITGELVTAGLAAYLHDGKMLRNPMHKSIAQFAFIGAVFQILSKKASDPIGNLVKQIPGLSGHEGYTGGVYFDPYTASQAVGGAYLPASSDMGGIYASVDQGTEMGGLGLFKAPSIYG